MLLLSHIKTNVSHFVTITHLCLFLTTLSSSFRVYNSPTNRPALTSLSNHRTSHPKFTLNLLPRDDDPTRNTYLITSPLFYLNGDPHLGHAYTLVASDVLKRYLVLSGHEAELLAGTDEHGSKIKSTSVKQGLAPRDYVLSMRNKFLDLYPAYGIDPDHIVHTSEEDHKKRVRATFDQLCQSQHIYRGHHSGYFCPKEDLYYPKSKLVNGKSPQGFDVLLVDEPAHFFRLSSWRNRLIDFYHKNPHIINPKQRLNEIMRILDSDLTDVAITRSNCDWGIEATPGETVYVWFDALTGYLSHLKMDGNRFSGRNVKTIHFLGKDILSFHTILWPAMLMSLGLDLPEKLIVHGWLLSNGRKISKSLNNSIPALPAPESSDVARLALLNLGDFRYDFEYDPYMFEKAHSTIRNKFANTCHRITSVLNSRDVNRINPPLHVSAHETDPTTSMLCKFKDLSHSLKESVESFRLDRYIQILVDMTYEINKFIEDRQFWLSESNSEDFLTTAWTACSLLFHLALHLKPITPILADEMLCRIRPSLRGNPISNPDLGTLDLVPRYSYNPVHKGPLTS